MKPLILLLLITSCATDTCSLGDMYRIAKEENVCLKSEQITYSASGSNIFIICPESVFNELIKKVEK